MTANETDFLRELRKLFKSYGVKFVTSDYDEGVCIQGEEIFLYIEMVQEELKHPAE